MNPPKGSREGWSWEVFGDLKRRMISWEPNDRLRMLKMSYEMTRSPNMPGNATQEFCFDFLMRWLGPHPCMLPTLETFLSHEQERGQIVFLTGMHEVLQDWLVRGYGPGYMAADLEKKRMKLVFELNEFFEVEQKSDGQSGKRNNTNRTKNSRKLPKAGA